MASERNRVWKSQLAQTLLESEGGKTVEEAALRLVDKKLSMIRSLKPPVDLKFVASIMDIQTEFNYVDMQEAARIVPHNGKYYLDVNRRHPKSRQRFSIGHEIGHKMLAGKKLESIKSRDSYVEDREGKEEEALCDLISGYILGLRPDILVPILLDRGFSFDTVQHITTEYETSFEATVRALIHFFDGDAAALYCVPTALTRHGTTPEFIISRYYTSLSFPLNWQRGQRVPELLCTKRAYMSETLIKLVENCAFDAKTHYQYECQAKKMPIYTGDQSEQGVVLLLLSPSIMF